MTGHTEGRAVNQHYGRQDLSETILSALRAAGKDPTSLAPADLAPLDQFHTGGRDATLDLARRAGFPQGIPRGARVLDVGGGLGGPARTLAGEFGCAVEVLDLTEEFCRSGALLTRMTGLEDLVSFRLGDALQMPYPDASFDLVWTQHSTMNIPNKDRLYGEITRVLRPGSRLAMHEIVAGPVSPTHFPVPWARDPAISHLLTQDALRAGIPGSGLREVSWADDSGPAIEWFEKRLAAASASSGPPHLGIHLLLGLDSDALFQNLLRNLREERAAVVQAVFQKPGSTLTGNRSQ